jgi:hypothetical protein
LQKPQRPFETCTLCRFLLGTPRINLPDASGLVSSNLVTSKLVHDEKSGRLSAAQMEQKIDLSPN